LRDIDYINNSAIYLGGSSSENKKKSGYIIHGNKCKPCKSGA
jgi:hypothetical protein